jgi:hypothetical protein
MHTCKHGDLLNVIELSVAFSVEAGPQVSDEDLRSLVQSDSPALERRLVPKAGEALCQ